MGGGENVIWLLIGFIFVAWGVYRINKMRQSGLPIFTKENFSKTMTTWGYLALMLIAVIGLCVMLLKT
jgi:hypothetical protein